MPFTQPTPPFLEVQYVYSCPTGDCVNRHFYSVIDGGTQLDVDNFVSGWEATQHPLFLNLIADDVFVLEGLVRYRSTTDLFSATFGESDVGTRADEAMPAQNTGVITWDIPPALVGGRIVRGRTGISGATEADSTNGVMTTTYHTALESYASSIWGAPPNFAGSPPVLSIWQPTKSLLNPVSGFRISRTWKVNRHRRPLS